MIRQKAETSLWQASVFAIAVLILLIGLGGSMSAATIQ